MKVVPENDWEVFSYRTEEGPVFATFHTEADKIPQAEYPHCARVIIPVKRPNGNGGPERDEAEVLWAMEDRLVEQLEARSVRCLLLGRLTHSGNRELVFQLADWEKFRPPVGRWMAEHPDYDIDVSEHEGWDFFMSAVWPSQENWMMIADRRVIDNLIKAGSDPEKPHSLEFVILGESAQLEQFSASLGLGERGYTQLDISPGEGQLILVKSMELDLGKIHEESLFLKRATEQRGLNYDGWGCTVVK
jgi:hypothetical protein